MEIKLQIDETNKFHIEALTSFLTLLGNHNGEEVKKKMEKIDGKLAVMAANKKEETTTEITVEELKAKVRKLTVDSNENTEKIRAKLEEFGSANVSRLKSEYYQDFNTFISEL
jgi:hypothetical protein